MYRYFSSYIIENGVCYLTLTEKMFPSRLAFGFLEDISKEFWRQHSSEVQSVVRPYSFIEFGRYYIWPFSLGSCPNLLVESQYKNYM